MQQVILTQGAAFGGHFVAFINNLTRSPQGRRMDYWPVALEGEGSNCFSITQLVRQKGYNKVSKCKLKKYLFGK